MDEDRDLRRLGNVLFGCRISMGCLLELLHGYPYVRTVEVDWHNGLVRALYSKTEGITLFWSDGYVNGVNYLAIWLSDD